MKQSDEFPTECGYLIKQISDGMGKKANNQLREHGLTMMQASILDFLQRSGGDVPLKKIETNFRISQPTVSGLCHRMEQKGLIELHEDPSNMSAKTARLTEKGAALIKDAGKETASMEETLLNGMDQMQKEELQSLLKKILNNLSD
ncbi:MAG: MarR family winged helix-turn-helix transcriptional regulator [Oscillospiraceae bacterium]|jgi:DNA-binding MarR family transcriptional regulator